MSFRVPVPLCEPQRLRALVLLVAALLIPIQSLAQVAQPAASSQRLANGDQVQLSVPGRPDLLLRLTLDGNGRVPIPQVGDVGLAGLTVDEAELVLRQRLRLFDPSIDSVQLILADEGTSVRVFVIGEVSNSGEYSFNNQPTLWDVLRAAGGPTDQANLARARVVREEGDRSEAFEVDLSRLMTGGTVPHFDLKNGDTLIVPAVAEVGAALLPGSGGVQVFGGVEEPSLVPITEPTPLLDVIMMAGSPSQEARLHDIYWVHRSGEDLNSRHVNLEDFIQRGNPLGNPLIYPGDAVHVNYNRSNWAQRNLPLILTALSSIATLYIAYDRVSAD
jgi:protein involved in polysaccharide export with SLBB domain